jgi:outer membrane immunogenic protein
MRKFLLAAAASFSAAAPAVAADFASPQAPPPAYPPPPIFTWTGLYVGAQIGYGWATNTLTVYPAGFGTNFTPNGVVGGAHLGYDWQMNQAVVGIEGDIEGTGIDRSFSPGGALYTTSIPVQGSIRGRLGIAFDQVLLYATGGVEFAGIDNSVSGIGIVDQSSQTRTGWTAGAGIEYAVTPNWYIRAEYRYTDFGHFGYATPFAFGFGSFINLHQTENAIRAGFSYKFDPFGFVSSHY